MDFKCKIIEVGDQHVLTMRTTTPVDKLPEFFGKAFGGIGQYLAELGEVPTGMPFGKYYNMDMNALDIEAGFPVSKELPEKGEIKANIIPAGKYGSAFFVGPYNAMEPAYEALAEYVKKEGLETTGIAYEYYLNDPGEGPDVEPETEVRYELK